MNDASIDAAIAEAFPQVSEAAVQDLTSNAAEENIDQAEDGEPGEAAQSDDVPFPKKAVNAISRRDKTIGKLRAENQHYQQRLRELEAGNAIPPHKQVTQGKPPALDAPKEEDYDTLGDYLGAVAEHKAEQKLAAHLEKQRDEQRDAQERAWIAQREDTVVTMAQDFMKNNPDAEALLAEHADLIDGFPEPIARLFLEAENAPLAFYNLAKAGKLEALASMTFAQAAMEIGRAQSTPITKPESKAPAPLPSARGPGGSKSLNQMSGAELRKTLGV